MAWPPSDIGTSNTDAGTDNPQIARGDILGLMQGFNLLRNHFSSFMQGLAEAASASAARAALGISARGGVESVFSSHSAGLTVVADGTRQALNSTGTLVNKGSALTGNTFVMPRAGSLRLSVERWSFGTPTGTVSSLRLDILLNGTPVLFSQSLTTPNTQANSGLVLASLVAGNTVQVVAVGFGGGTTAVSASQINFEVMD